MTTTITPEQADTLPTEAIDLDPKALEAAENAYAAAMVVSDRDCEDCEGSGFVKTGRRTTASCPTCGGLGVVTDFPEGWNPMASAITAYLARRADDHYFAVDYTGCIHEAPDRETAIRWAEDFARTANGGTVGSERPEVAKTISQMIEASKARVAAMTPAEREEMYREQRESFVRSMRPCEHGVADWEDCPKCRSLARRAAVPSLLRDQALREALADYAPQAPMELTEAEAAIWLRGYEAATDRAVATLDIGEPK